MRDFDDKDLEVTSKKNFSYFFIFSFLVFFVLVYVYFLIFGPNSIDTYNNLKQKKLLLQKQEKILEQENIKLQQKYFELKELEGQI